MIDCISLKEYFRRYQAYPEAPVASIDWRHEPEPQAESHVVVAKVLSWIQIPQPHIYQEQGLDAFRHFLTDIQQAVYTHNSQRNKALAMEEAAKEMVSEGGN
jgi:hypothetical protein